MTSENSAQPLLEGQIRVLKQDLLAVDNIDMETTVKTVQRLLTKEVPYLSPALRSTLAAY